ncbi:helix-turn-helix domain-containing protein [Tropicimonas sp. TH_r6]|uniref:helix-turn-helix domain-containing protein n=1 Tax=Tropicimonas sp. TH_r6 TaxID=3082085 RepID=UPI0029530443|nr:helix-turn-helix domain-containing protein [Tropicimonas sp. TH_r6]MDV7145394.1 helix-turn-helix domain-containing protein [Tropicimonas sp. TH_r6]
MVILEEISSLNAIHQGNLLRFADEALVQHIRKLSPRQVKSRIVCTSSVDLRAAAENNPQPASPKTESETSRPLSERDWIADALVRNGFQKAKAAKELGMSTRTLYSKIKKYHLQQ